MKSLGIFHRDSHEYRHIRDLLESRGIPTDITRTSEDGPVALYVCINAQYADALALLENPEHVVAQPVDIAQYRRSFEAQGLDAILKGCIVILVVFIAVFGILAALRVTGNLRPGHSPGSTFHRPHLRGKPASSKLG